MRVCFVSPSSYCYFDSDEDIAPGGTERQLYLLGRELASEFSVHFVVGDYGQPKTEHRDGVTLHRSYTPHVDANPVRRLAQVGRLLSAMDRADADVYVFRGDHPRAILTGVLARVLGRKWVYNLALDSEAEAGRGLVASSMRRLFERTVSSADRIVAQTPHQQRRLRESFGVDSTVVPNGYPPISGERRPEDGEFFLFVGRIDPGQKRPHLFLELARQFPEESFVMVGPEDDDPEYYRRVVAEAERLDNVEFLGAVAPDEIHDYFDRAIALVNTSSQEGFPNTFLEAWRYATPVLSLDVDPGRFLSGDATGYAGGEFDELVALTEDLADSPETRRALGETGRQHFEENYRISATAETYADVLRTCVS